MESPLNCPENGDALGFEYLDGVDLELVGILEPLVQVHHPGWFYLPVDHATDDTEGLFLFETNQQDPFWDVKDPFLGQR
jgi:hypothetical protein